MKRLLIALLVVGMAQAAGAQTVGFIVKNPSTEAGRGRDSVLANLIATKLDYNIAWLDYDNIVSTYNSAYFDTFWLMIIAGSAVSDPLPSDTFDFTPGDTITNAFTNVMCLSSNGWDEVNLATGRAVTNYSNASPTNLGRDLFATRVLADTVQLWGSNSVQHYQAVVADTGMGDVRAVLVHNSDVDDTARSWMMYADSGATLVNTGDGRTIAKGRRMLLLPWNYQEQTIDSCQWYTLFLRSVVMMTGDTSNAGVFGDMCFSGINEVLDSWSGGSEPQGLYNAYTSSGNYQGRDFDDKVTFWKIDSLALVRKAANVYRSATVGEVNYRIRIAGFGVEYSEATIDSNWECHIVYVPSRKPLKISNNNTGGSIASNTYPNACYYWAQIDTAGGIATGDTILWAEQPPGADTTEDVYWEPSDTAEWSRAASAIGDYHSYSLNADRWTSFLLEPALQYGYLSKVVYSNQSSYSPPGVEVTPSSSNSTTLTYARPLVTVSLSSWSTTSPTPSIAIEHDSLVFTATEGGSNPVFQNNVVSNSSGGALACQSFSDDAAWLTLVTYDEGTPYTIRNTVNITGLAAGYYSGIVTNQCDDADNTPQTYKVALTVSAAAPDPSAGAVERRTGLRKQ